MIRGEIKKLIENSIKVLQKERVFPEFAIPEIVIEHPEEKIHGDYATNVAMVIAKIVKKDPMEIANILSEKLKVKSEKLFEKIEVAAPGFINFFISATFFIDELKRILKEKDRYGSSEIGKGKTVVIDYSSPNIAKPFGIGHLRSTINGQALYNIYKFLYWECIGDNHLGDWGTQFGKLIVAIKRWGEKEIKDYSIEDLEKLYVKFHQEAELNPQLEEEARSWFKKLEGGDKEAKKIWKICIDISLKEFERIYKLLGVKIDYALGESFYEGMLKEIIDEAKEKKVAIESQGALIIQYPNNELPPTIVLKSDGATTYLTRDLATVKYRLKKWKPNLIIYEVGADQTLHFKQLFRAIALLGWVKKEKLFHVAHGLIRLKEGKFSTRKGLTIHLEEVLKEAISKAEEIIEKSETGRGLLEKERKKIAKMVGIGAVKYNDLSQHHSGDIIFDWGKILNLKGNSGPYLQYTFARCQSVLRKAKLKIEPGKIKIADFNLEEENLLRTIYKFPEVVEEAAEKFSPNLVCNFAFDLTQKYNLFYDLHPIIKAETGELKIFRLALTSVVARVLKNSLSLLGISTPERM
jgi:arginyl-tRNA synthetase